ncbi:aldo/keto reductase [Mucilaginibacter sp.]|uniref:aldo/keto reductase n=1 Tax=Mucilaginibacter sp. TaxID=1882438 RepID=UPI0025D551CF|nr:aldo/keto reductase [Mucilaginibacter sp.]
MDKEIKWPEVIFGTSGLGNLYEAVPFEQKRAIVKACLQHSEKPVCFDSAGKYGAGLALEALGRSLKELGVNREEVLISNKLGWLRTNLNTPEPTFEPGVWRDLKHDAIQKISYDGILECYQQGNELLNGYKAELVSVHDPDEYLANAKDAADRKARYLDILEAYRALSELKASGEVKSIGVGSKDWRIIKHITNEVKLDWVMIANSMTIHSHPKALLAYMQSLESQGIAIINSAVFNGGFLVGSGYYNYLLKDPIADKSLFDWREKFNRLCAEHGIQPVEACIVFGKSAPGVKCIALNTTKAEKVAANITLMSKKIPDEFWTAMKQDGLIEPSCTFI